MKYFDSNVVNFAEIYNIGENIYVCMKNVIFDNYMMFSCTNYIMT
jgi:hypothetical protein